MPSPTISIIVPIFNSEKTLLQCLDSIKAQTFSDFEVLMVNDGSTDSSRNIIDEYAANDNRFIALHKDNGGVSSARNYGLDREGGEWITFIDSDDWVESVYLEDLSDAKSYDLIVNSFVLENTSEIWDDQVPTKNFIGPEIRNCLNAFSNICNFTAPWCKLFRGDIISKYNIRFDIRINNGEDSLFVLNYILHISSIRTSNKRLYHYNHGDSTLSKNYATIAQNYYLYSSLYKELIDHLSTIFNCNNKLLLANGCFGFFVKSIEYVRQCNISFYNRRRLIKQILSTHASKLILRNTMKRSLWKRQKLFNLIAKTNSATLITLYLLIHKRLKGIDWAY